MKYILNKLFPDVDKEYIDNLGNTFDIINGNNDRDKMINDPYSLNFVKKNL